MSATPLQPGERRIHEHPEAGQFYVSHFFGDHPAGRPFFTNGRFYDSEAAAVAGFFAQCEESDEKERRSIREALAVSERRTADHIDGYDRDDLGESPDF